MSDKSLNSSNNNKTKKSKNSQSTKIYYNQLINKIDLNNIISNSSISINDTKSNYNDKDEDNLQNNTSFSNKSFENNYKTHHNLDNIISILYKELISLINVSNKYTLFNDENKNEKNIKILKDKNTTKESIINIFKKTFIKIIDFITKELKENIEEYKSYILLLEQNNRYFIQQNFLKQTKIDILENEIDSYMEMEEEFDEMKEKFKYENGKFLHNEKKENEILILRAENSNLKKIIDKNEKTIEEKDIIIESIKNKSSSLINTNKNTMKNSFDLNENENSSLIVMHKKRMYSKQKLSHNNSNINNFKKVNSPINNCINNNLDNFKTNINNNYNSNKSLHIKKISYGENLSSKINTKDLINKKLKNKVLNMKKIRRINNSGLDNYNKSSIHITNSIMSSSSNNSNSKRMRKNINSFYKNSKNNINIGVNKIHKKLSSGLTNSNINNDTRYPNNIIKSNNNKIIVNSILDNNDKKKINKINKSFLLKTSDKKFYMAKKKKKTKATLKTKKDELILERNSYSLIKSPTTFNSNNIENSIGMKNNIIINNIIQNSSAIPVSVQREQSKSKEKINVSEFEQNQNLSHRFINNKSAFLSVNIKMNKNKK